MFSSLPPHFESEPFKKGDVMKTTRPLRTNTLASDCLHTTQRELIALLLACFEANSLLSGFVGLRNAMSSRLFTAVMTDANSLAQNVVFPNSWQCSVQTNFPAKFCNCNVFPTGWNKTGVKTFFLRSAFLQVAMCWDHHKGFGFGQYQAISGQLSSMDQSLHA